jgi:hypothetical protein
MEQLSQIFLSWQALITAFAVFVVVRIAKTLGTTRDEKGQPIGGYARTRTFRTVLPVLPYIVGLGLVFLPKLPLPELVVQQAGRTITVKILFALYAAFISDKIYTIIKSMFESKGLKVGDDQQE